MIPLLPVWCFCCRCYISRTLRSTSPFLCINCYSRLPVIEKALCRRCGLAHPTAHCQESWARDIDSFQSLFYYQDPIHHWIINHKYSGGFFAGRLLRSFVGSWFAEHSDDVSEIDAVLPVPIHHLRLRRRGFNQAAFLLKSQKQLPVKTDWIKKIQNTSQQAGLKEDERRENVRGAFTVKADVEGLNLMIFDDVCTTGQTLGEVCFCLKKAGVAQVHVLTLSRSM